MQTLLAYIAKCLGNISSSYTYNVEILHPKLKILDRTLQLLTCAHQLNILQLAEMSGNICVQDVALHQIQ